MPVMDGMEFVERIRRHELWRTIPLVVLTDVDLDIERQELLAGYTSLIIEKNCYSPAELLFRLHAQIVGHIRSHPATAAATPAGTPAVTDRTPAAQTDE